MKERCGYGGGNVTLAVNPRAPERGHLPRSTKPIPPNTALSWLGREAEIGKAEAYGTKGWR